MNNIGQPTLLLNEAICRSNIRRMANKVRSLGLEFRPHFKTHQSYTIGNWIKEEGVTGITVSSLKMAAYFANEGWDDITVAFPCNIAEIKKINALASKIQLRVLVSTSEVVPLLKAELAHSVKAYIEIDSGGGRTGFATDEVEVTTELIDNIKASDKLEFCGLYSHAGHTYSCKGKDDIIATSRRSLEQLSSLAKALNLTDLDICYGDTPSCSVLDTFGPATQLSPGNFVFYDVMQTQIGSCEFDQVAVAVACPIVAIDEKENQLYIYGGAVHFSKERDGKYNFGRIGRLTASGWELLEGRLERVSQEHGIVSLNKEEIKNLHVGDSLLIFPIHSCLTADCIGSYYTIEDQRIDHMSEKRCY